MGIFKILSVERKVLVLKFRGLFISLVLLVFLSCSGVAFAAEDYPVLIIVDTDNNNENFSDLCSDINEALHNEGYFAKGYGSNVQYVNFITYGEEKGVVKITLNMSDYKNLKQKTKKEVYDLVLGSISESTLTQNNKTKLYNFIQEQDTVVSNLVKRLSDDVGADFVAGYALFRPFAGVIGWALGLAAVTIFITLSLTIMLDISYLVIPAANMAFSKLAEKELFTTGFKYDFISLEAKKAYDEACASDGIRFKNAIGLYFGMKSKSLAALAICLVYLLNGQIFNVLASFMDLFTGFLPR